MATLEELQNTMRGLFPDHLGIRLIEAGPDRVTAEMEGREELCTLPGTIHGGALMALADTLGAYGTVLNLAPGASTTTIESKTNFFARAAAGRVLRAVATPLHKGRRTMVWQTRVETDGKLAALVTQTQIVLPARTEPREQLRSMFEGLSAEQQKTMLATLERDGAAMYRALAQAEPDETTRASLLEAAEREEANALVLEKLTGGA